MQTPSKKNWLYGLLIGCLALITLANLGGLGYFYHRCTHQYIISKHQIQTNQSALANIEQKLQEKNPNIGHIFALYQIKSLLSQAQFQINSFGDIRVTRQYLKFANQIAQNKHLEPLAQTIQSDLQTLTQIHLTPVRSIILALNQLQQQLENQQDPKPQMPSQTSSPSTLPMWAQNLRPLIQIDRYQVTSAVIYAPTEQAKLIQQALALIANIQYAALHHQERNYQEWLHQLYLVLEQLPPDQVIQKALTKLLNAHLKLEKHLDFQSYPQVHQLIENENLA